MNNSPEQHDPHHEPVSVPEMLGTLLFLGGVALLLLVFFSKAPGVSLPLPRVWYRNEVLWPFIAVGMGVAGYFLQQRNTSISVAWKPALPGQRFQRVLIYSRPECHLCDVAKDTLHRFAEWLPVIEEIDINESAELIDKYGESIPVIEIDGTERFRGVVNEVLLKRLIEAAPPSNPASPAETPTN